MRFLFGFVAMFVLCTSGHAQAPAKLALVIANGDYDGESGLDGSEAAHVRAAERRYVGDLPNALMDGQLVADALRGAGYEVEIFRNADRAMMAGAVMRFYAQAEMAGPSAQTIIYYAGHAIQVGGANYLIGTRARLPEIPATLTGDDLTRMALGLGMPLTEMLVRARPPQAPGFNLVLIDACRDNPWEELLPGGPGRERGFVVVHVSTPRTVVAFSSGPGQMAEDGEYVNGPYASALARRLRQPGAPIDRMLEGVMGEVAAMTSAQQIPWVRGRLNDNTCVSGC